MCLMLGPVASGAMSVRLTNLRYQALAIDIVRENFRLHSKAPFASVNLN
jgi:hypothetical protein